MNNKNYKYIFGTVPSRRLGISLGIDLMPHKTCTLDCVYCESGKTTELTTERKEYIPVNKIIDEINIYLGNNPHPDYITFSGSGEPTLHSGIGEIGEYIKSNYPDKKIALLTNSTLFNLPDLRSEVKNLDLIIASLDAVSKDIFIKINRPHPDLVLDDIIEGLINLRSEFFNHLCLEIFIVPDKNDNKIELNEIKKISSLIRPDNIQINSLDRPGTCEWVKNVKKNMLYDIAKFMNGAEPVKTFKKKIDQINTNDAIEKIITTIKRRPCTLHDITNSFGIDKNQALNVLDSMIAQKKVMKKKMKRGIFFIYIN